MFRGVVPRAHLADHVCEFAGECEASEDGAVDTLGPRGVGVEETQEGDDGLDGDGETGGTYGLTGVQHPRHAPHLHVCDLHLRRHGELEGSSI